MQIIAREVVNSKKAINRLHVQKAHMTEMEMALKHQLGAPQSLHWCTQCAWCTSRIACQAFALRCSRVLRLTGVARMNACASKPCLCSRWCVRSAPDQYGSSRARGGVASFFFVDDFVPPSTAFSLSPQSSCSSVYWHRMQRWSRWLERSARAAR